MVLAKVTPQQLLDRNRSWNEEVERNDSSLLKENAAGQTPSILWIGCSDSRVPESVVANCKPGDVFTHRNIANQFNLNDDSAMSVLTYGVEALGIEHGESVPNILDSMNQHSSLPTFLQSSLSDTRPVAAFWLRSPPLRAQRLRPAPPSPAF